MNHELGRHVHLVVVGSSSHNEAPFSTIVPSTQAYRLDHCGSYIKVHHQSMSRLPAKALMLQLHQS